MRLGYAAMFLGVALLAGAARADGTPPSLGDNMKSIAIIFKALQQATPAQYAQSVPQAKQMATLFTAVQAQVPAVIASMPAAQQPAALADFKSLIQQEIDLSNQLATALQGGNSADVAKALTDMANIKTEGHGKYNP